MKKVTYWAMVLLLLGAALLLRLRPARDLVPPSLPLQQFPVEIAGYGSTELLIAPEARAILGDGDFLSRAYTSSEKALPVTLLIGYFPSQRTGSTIHSPKNCLPGAGWSFDSQQYTEILDRRGKAHQVGEYVISNADSRQFVLYWYEAHGRSVASEYAAKFYLIADAVRKNRTDGALVRIMTPIDPGKGEAEAKNRAEIFAAEVAPRLSPFIPD